MYYHVIIETNEKNKQGHYQKIYEINNTDLAEVVKLIVRPYVFNESVYIDGRNIQRKDIRQLKVKSSEKTTREMVDIAQSKVSPNVFFVYTTAMVLEGQDYTDDITKNIISSIDSVERPNAFSAEETRQKNNKIFIVHGRDDLAKIEVARFVEKLGFSAIILHEQASSGKTIIEKIEEHTDVGFAVVLYTPCDIGGLAGNGNQKSRARQNVVFEHGYLIGKLGRHNVCALVKGDVEIPNDISGIVYIGLDTYSAWNLILAKELRKAGYGVDLNKLDA